MERSKIENTVLQRSVHSLKRRHVSVTLSTNEFRQDYSSRKPLSAFHTKDKVTGSARRATVSVDERMYVIERPKHVRRQRNRICFLPPAVNLVHEILHQCAHSVVIWRIVCTTVTARRLYSPALVCRQTIAWKLSAFRSVSDRNVRWEASAADTIERRKSYCLAPFAIASS